LHRSRIGKRVPVHGDSRCASHLPAPDATFSAEQHELSRTIAAG
jgi:hypothetical protein